MSLYWVVALALAQAQPAPADAEPEPAPGAVEALLGPPTVTPPPARAERPSPAGVRPFEMPAVVPVTPDPSVAVRLPDAPVRLEDYRGQYEPPKDVVQLRFERGVADNLRRAAALAGPLEGAWRVERLDGAPLLALVLFHTGEGGTEVDGAWRDLARPGVPGASGPILSASRDATGALTLRFQPAGASRPAVLTLAPSAPRWTGALTLPDAAPVPVALAPED